MMVAALDIDPPQSVLTRRTLRLSATSPTFSAHSPVYTQPGVEAASSVVATAIARAMSPRCPGDGEAAIAIVDADRSATARAAWNARRPRRLEALARALEAHGLTEEAWIARNPPEPIIGEMRGHVPEYPAEPQERDIDLSEAFARLYRRDA